MHTLTQGLVTYILRAAENLVALRPEDKAGTLYGTADGTRNGGRKANLFLIRSASVTCSEEREARLLLSR